MSDWIQKAKDFIKGNPEQAGQGLDKAEEIINERTGGKYADQLDQGTDKVREGLGLPPPEPAPGPPTPEPLPPGAHARAPGRRLRPLRRSRPDEPSSPVDPVDPPPVDPTFPVPGTLRDPAER